MAVFSAGPPRRSPSPRLVISVLSVSDRGYGLAGLEDVTTSVTLTVRVRGPLVARIVNGYFPAGVSVVVATVSVLEPSIVTDTGLNHAVAPDGNPVTLKSTAPVKPVPGVTVAV